WWSISKDAGTGWNGWWRRVLIFKYKRVGTSSMVWWSKLINEGKNMKHTFAVWCASIVLATTAMAQEVTAPKTVVLKAERIFDAEKGTYANDQAIVIEGERIKAVVPSANLQVPAGAEVIELGHATLLPGLIDCHTHLSSRADRYGEIYSFKDTDF